MSANVVMISIYRGLGVGQIWLFVRARQQAPRLATPSIPRLIDGPCGRLYDQLWFLVSHALHSRYDHEPGLIQLADDASDVAGLPTTSVDGFVNRVVLIHRHA